MSLAPKFFQTSVVDDVYVITINRPEVMNALHPPASHELHSILTAFMADSSLRVAVLIGSGRAFCAGNDMKYQSTGASSELPPGGFGGLTAWFERPKPVIAAVHGVAYGGGFELALACDLIIASRCAKFALPEVQRGVIAAAGGLLRLPSQMPKKIAMGMILTGRSLSANLACQFGLVNQLADRNQLLKVAMEWAADIAAASPAAILASRAIINHGLANSDLQAAYSRQKSLPEAMALYNSPDFIEGPKAFAEKRMPVWVS